MLILAAAVCVVVIIITHYLLKHRRFITMALKIPGPTFVPLIGDILLLLRHKFNIIEAFDLINNGYGKIYRAWTRILLIFISTPDDLETFCNHSYNQSRGPIFEGFAEKLGNKNLIMADWDSDAKHSKKIFHRAFNCSSQEIVFENFRISSKKMLCLLKPLEDKWIDVFHVVKYATSIAIVGSALDCDLDDYPSLRDTFVDRFELVAFYMACRTLSPLHRIDFLYKQFLGGKLVSQAIDMAEVDVDKIISQKREKLAGLITEGKEVPNQYIYNLLRSNTKLTGPDLRSEVETILLAALDSSAITVAYALVMLAMHPEIQELVYLEDQQVQKKLNGVHLDEKNIANYEYLSRVVKETLRMYTPVSVLARFTQNDTRYGKHIVPKGATVIASILSLHRDPVIYENPSVFNPNRFLPENFMKIPKYSYLPFGGGVRMCPGSRYGTHSAIYLVSSVVRNYRLFTKYKTAAEMDKDLEMNITICQKNGFPLRLEPRSTQNYEKSVY